MGHWGASGVSRRARTCGNRTTLADRIYFLRKGRVVVMTAKPHERPVALRTIEPDQPFGELCLCSVRAGIRGTTACALVASEAFEIKLSKLPGLPAPEPRGARER